MAWLSFVCQLGWDRDIGFLGGLAVLWLAAAILIYSCAEVLGSAQLRGHA